MHLILLCVLIPCAIYFGNVSGASVSDSSIEATQFRCDSGELIEDTLLCDGIAHCPDNSDETEKHCLQIPCPRVTYRCRYGACVRKSSICNDIKDCFDGSDEEACARPIE